MKNLFIATALSLFAITATAGSMTAKARVADRSGDDQAFAETIEQCNDKVGDYYRAWVLAKGNLYRAGGGWDFDNTEVYDLPEHDQRPFMYDEVVYLNTKAGLKKDYATFDNSVQFCDALAEFIKSDDEITF